MTEVADEVVVIEDEEDTDIPRKVMSTVPITPVSKIQSTSTLRTELPRTEDATLVTAEHLTGNMILTAITFILIGAQRCKNSRSADVFTRKMEGGALEPGTQTSPQLTLTFVAIHHG